MNGASPAQTMIAAMITPALLILASGSLIATALVRLGRVVDRVRKLGEKADATPSLDELERNSPSCVSSSPVSRSRSITRPGIAGGGFRSGSRR
jgi:Protein of unknown function (DUF2721)